MALGPGLHRILFFRLWVGVAALAAIAPVSAFAGSPAKQHAGPLSPDLEVLARPQVAAGSPAVQANRIGVPNQGPGSLVREGERVLVTARFDRGAIAAFEPLRDAGARVVDASAATQTLTLAVDPEDLPALAAVPGLEGAWQLREPIVYAEGSCDGGSVLSEGAAQLRVDEAREAFELRGKGLTVGVLSDSFDTARRGAQAPATDAEDDEVSNDLPGPSGTCSAQQLPVDVLEDFGKPGSDEGRAMLQIVHDLAPHAGLAFATAFRSEEGFAENIELLARPVSAGGAGADVIVDDVAWAEEPFFQEGPVAVAIDRVTDGGVTYLSATGNDNLFEGSTGREISSWEAAAFRDAGLCPAPVATVPVNQGIHCMDFDPGPGLDNTFGITVAAGQTLTLNLQWAEPWYGVATDLDAFLLSDTEVLDESFEDNIDETQRPFEFLQWENEDDDARTVYLAINRYAGGSPRLKFVLAQNGGGVEEIEYPQSSGGDVVGPSIYGHAGSPSAISVAAVPFNNSAAVESYSSRGPVTHYFGPVESTAPAAALGAPEAIPKPDLAATDCGATTFFAHLQGGAWRFCGTSAAAPHAAAVAALVRQAKPTLPAQQVRDTLTATASPIGAFPAKAAGAGLIDAFDAISSLPGPIEGGDGPSARITPVAVTPPPGPAAPIPAPPETLILKRPAKVVRSRSRAPRLVFRFGSDQAGAVFHCRVDRSPFRTCSRRTVRRFAHGSHMLRVKAESPAGRIDPTPAVYRFRVVSAS
jgi:subtilisin family serine protease